MKDVPKLKPMTVEEMASGPLSPSDIKRVDPLRGNPRFIAVEEVDKLIEKAVDRVLERVDRLMEEEDANEEV